MKKSINIYIIPLLFIFILSYFKVYASLDSNNIIIKNGGFFKVDDTKWCNITKYSEQNDMKDKCGYYKNLAGVSGNEDLFKNISISLNYLSGKNDIEIILGTCEKKISFESKSNGKLEIGNKAIDVFKTHYPYGLKSIFSIPKEDKIMNKCLAPGKNKLIVKTNLGEKELKYINITDNSIYTIEFDGDNLDTGTFKLKRCKKELLTFECENNIKNPGNAIWVKPEKVDNNKGTYSLEMCKGEKMNVICERGCKTDNEIYNKETDNCELCQDKQIRIDNKEGKQVCMPKCVIGNNGTNCIPF